MKRSLVGRAAGVASAVAIFVGIVHAANAPGTNLYISGGLASSRVIQHDGIAYVPVSDIAKALNQTVIAKADGYAITPAGGANQVSGMNGKIGDKLANGEIQMTVVKAFRTPKYTYQFGNGEKQPNNPNDDVVVIVVRLKNMLNKTVGINLAGQANTALTDQDEHSYSTGPTDTHYPFPDLLPGSAYDFAMLYVVPKTEKVGDLVYQVAYTNYKGKPVTFRVSLASINE